MTRPHILRSILLGCALAYGCAGDGAGDATRGSTTSSTHGGDESASATSAPGGASVTESDSASTMAEATTSGASTASGSTGEDCTFLVCDDTQGTFDECDHWAQDCPDGQKCTAWASSGGTWDAVKCVDVTGMHVAGDPCTSEGAVSGVDSCIKGAMCWGISDGVGTCVALCTGSPDAPICENHAACTLSGSGVLILCLLDCDPLVQDCPGPAEACYPVGDRFSCALDVSGDAGAFGDACEFINACDKGLACLSTAFVGASCAPGSLGCCSPFCQFPGGDCPGADQACVQWHDPMQFPKDDPKLDIGVCGVPE